MQMHFKRLRELRKENGFTQIKLAEVMNIEQTVYSRYERGHNTIPLAHLIFLANLYSVSVDYILERTDIKSINK